MDTYYQAFAYLVAAQKFFKDEIAQSVRALASGEGISLSMIAMAAALGAIHALTPGHGKAVVFSYFIGRKARPIEGFTTAAKVAFAHTTTALLLVFIFGGAVTLLGRPHGAAAHLQTVSYFLIMAIGAFYLFKALRPAKGESLVIHRHLLPYAIGVLPCPLTMAVAGHALALGSMSVAVMLSALMGLGAALTIGTFGLIAIALRLGFQNVHWLSGRAANIAFATVEIVSSSAILAIGLVFFVGQFQ